jgi:chloride channel protein, CIC family
VLPAATAMVITRSFPGSNPAILAPDYALRSSLELLFYFVLGFLAAFTCWVFIKVLYKCEDIFDALRIKAYFKPAIGGLILPITGF